MIAPTLAPPPASGTCSTGRGRSTMPHETSVEQLVGPVGQLVQELVVEGPQLELTTSTLDGLCLGKRCACNPRQRVSETVAVVRGDLVTTPNVHPQERSAPDLYDEVRYAS